MALLYWDGRVGVVGVCEGACDNDIKVLGVCGVGDDQIGLNSPMLVNVILWVKNNVCGELLVVLPAALARVWDELLRQRLVARCCGDESLPTILEGVVPGSVPWASLTMQKV
jgi:hypothetical protein